MPDVWWYFWFVSRRIDLRPEDRDDSEIVDGAGEIGFFSPGSYYPLGISVATIVTGLGLVFLYWWLIALGIVGILGWPRAAALRVLHRRPQGAHSTPTPHCRAS